MYVNKRDGKKEAIKFDKITARIMKMCYGLDPIVSPEAVAMKVIEGIYDGVLTTDLDNLAADVAATRAVEHPDYAILASRIAVSNLHKETKKSFSEVIEDLYNNCDSKTGESNPLIAEDVYTIITENKEILDSTIIYDRDFKFDYFGFKIIVDSFLLRINGIIVERPQQLLMRVAVGMHKRDIQSVIKTYNYMSEGWLIHDTQLLQNAGKPNAQMASSFSLEIKEDSISGIYDTLKSTAKIAQSFGEIGLAIHSVSATGSLIKETNSFSNGIIPMLRVFNETASYTTKRGKRKSNFSIYLEPWHADILDFLNITKSHINDELSTRNLNCALWLPDLFMERVKNNEDWTLMSPSDCPNLQDTFGKSFKKLYTKYEAEGKGTKTIKAQDLWFKILESQIETGMPYMLYKDTINSKSNQQNLGVIKTSNGAANITEFTSSDEIAVCSSASIALPKFVTEEGEFSHDKLFEVTYQVALNLNKLIDENGYPVIEAENSSRRNRPIGIGVQGLADVFALLGFSFDSVEAKTINREIFETIYYAALTASKDLAKEEGAYESYKGSPISKGIFQFDMWNSTPTDRWEWKILKEEIKKYGIRNALLVTQMPTTIQSQILGNSEGIEPLSSNVSIKHKQSGEFTIVNKYLLRDLLKEGLWNKEMCQKIMSSNGSIQGIDKIPQKIKNSYKTIWEISQKAIIDLAIDRGAYICQSQSMGIFMENADFGKLTSMHFYGWEKGLKTGMYCLNTKTTTEKIQFTIDNQMSKPNENIDQEQQFISRISFDNLNDSSLF